MRTIPFARLSIVVLFAGLGGACGSQTDAPPSSASAGSGATPGSAGSGVAAGGASSNGGSAGSLLAGAGGGVSASAGASTGGASSSAGSAGNSSGGSAGAGNCPAPVGNAPFKPFPQHIGYPGCPDCAHPSGSQATLDADVTKLYAQWKTLLKTWTSGPLTGETFISAGAAGDINGWPQGMSPCTQSEGHGYAMLTLALMAGYDADAKKRFDSMDRVRKAFPSSSDPRLMSWALPKSGDTTLKAQPPATDGDQDMAYALLLAHDQWGDEAQNHYLAEAASIIAGMEAKFITAGTGTYFPRLNIGDPNHLGSVAPESKPFMTRPSDYVVSHWRAFGLATGHQLWADLETGSLNILSKVSNATTGLVPDFVVADPPVPSTTGTGDEGPCYDCYDYNACRVPWRQAVSVAHYGVAGSRQVLTRLVTWASGKFANDPGKFTAGFKLDGTAEAGRDFSDPAFTSPMAAAGIASNNQAWLDKGWASMKGVDGTDYYGGSITLLSMLLVSGNWWLPTGGVCAQ